MRIYLDYNATTPVDPAVLDAMLPYFAENFGNASSIHSPGQRARGAVDGARASVAAFLGAKPSEIVFTSGGTEADNLALFGVVTASQESRKHVITTAIEHHAVLNAAQALEKSWRRSHLYSRGPRRHRRSRRYSPRSAAGNDSHQRDAREQRTRHHSAHRRNWPHRCRRESLLPLRRRADGRKDAARCEPPRRGPALHFRAQDLRPEGNRRAVRSPGNAARAAILRRASRTGSPPRDGKRSRHRWPGKGRGTARARI